MMSTRREVADGLKKALGSYFLKKGFSCHFELGTIAWGRRRADMVAVNLRANVVIAEVKSCKQDYVLDNKWTTYLDHCNKFFFTMTASTWDALKETESKKLREFGCGVLILCPKTGYLKSVLPAKERKMNGKAKRAIVTRMAWRAGDMSRRTNRRVRVFL
jgi:hypothetical protein